MARVIVDAEEDRADHQERDRDDLQRDERRAEDRDRGGDRDDGVRGRESAHDGRSAGFHRAEPGRGPEGTADAARDAERKPRRREAHPAGTEEEPRGVDGAVTEGVQDEHPG